LSENGIAINDQQTLHHHLCLDGFNLHSTWTLDL